MRIRQFALLLGLCALTAFAWLRYSAPPTNPPDSAGITRPAELPSVRDTDAHVDTTPSTPPIAAPQDAVHAAKKASSMAVQLRRREVLARAFEESGDLLAFVRSILAAAKAGDVEAQVAIAQALSECSDADLKAGPEKRLTDPNLDDATRESFERQLHRCETLRVASPDDVGTSDAWMKRAAEGGSGPAIMEVAEDPKSGDTEHRIAEFHRAIDAGDPLVLFSLMVYYDATHDSSPWWGRSGTGWTAAAAMTLAQCQLGVDCSDKGMLYRMHCANGRCGNADTLQRYYELRLNPQQYADVQAQVQILVDRFLSGRYDWPEAQAYEDRIRNPPDKSTELNNRVN
jgi:hypothetical protein